MGGLIGQEMRVGKKEGRERGKGGQEGKGDKSRRKLYYTTHFATKYYL